MINKISLLFLLTISSIQAQTTFEWETAVDSGNFVTETLDGITATFFGLEDIDIVDCGGCFGSTANLVVSQGTTDGTSVSFLLSEPATINSILAIDGNGNDIDYTFTPSGGNNPTVVASLVAGSATVTLDWTNIASFTVSSTGSLFGFDNLEINSTLSIDDFSTENINIFPNPTDNILTVESDSRLKSISVINTLGQLVMKSSNNIINVSKLTAGMYILNIETEAGISTRKIIKE